MSRRAIAARGFATSMDQLNPWWIGGGVACLALVVAAGLWVRRFGHSVQIERARELFRLQHERFEEMLVAAAAATGKPRGLRWVSVQITGDALLARNAHRAILALVPVQIQFEPVEGSDMENVPAAKEPRVATAIFTFHRGHWHTDGRVLFNLDPHQALTHFGTGLAVVDH